MTNIHSAEFQTSDLSQNVTSKLSEQKDMIASITLKSRLRQGIPHYADSEYFPWGDLLPGLPGLIFNEIRLILSFNYYGNCRNKWVWLIKIIVSTNGAMCSQSSNYSSKVYLCTFNQNVFLSLFATNLKLQRLFPKYAYMRHWEFVQLPSCRYFFILKLSKIQVGSGI